MIVYMREIIEKRNEHVVNSTGTKISVIHYYISIKYGEHDNSQIPIDKKKQPFLY
jgi:hypothetical protein